LRIVIIKFVLLYCLLIGPVSAGFICSEAPSSHSSDWLKPSLPKMSSDQSSRLARYCHTNLHKFDTHSASLSRPAKPLVCYAYQTDGLVIELPNGLFCERWSDSSLDWLVVSYTLSLAEYNKSGFELVLYNEKHRVYRRLVLDHDHLLFDRIHILQSMKKRMAFVLEKIRLGDYPAETANCIYWEKTKDGEDCPSEISSKTLTSPVDVEDLKRVVGQMPLVEHEELK